MIWMSLLGFTDTTFYLYRHLRSLFHHAVWKTVTKRQSCFERFFISTDLDAVFGIRHMDRVLKCALLEDYELGYS